MTELNTRNRIIEVIRRGQRGLDGDVGLTTTVTKNATFLAVAGERGYVYRCTAALTANFEQASTLTNGWHCIIDAVGGDVTLNPFGAETINGLSTLVVSQNASALVYTDGVSLYARFFFGSAYTALNGLPTAADKYLYGTGVGVWAEGDITAQGRALLDDASASDQLSTLGVTPFAKTLLDDADATAARATLGVLPASSIASTDLAAFYNAGISAGIQATKTSGTITMNTAADDVEWARIGDMVYVFSKTLQSTASSGTGSVYLGPVAPYSCEGSYYCHITHDGVGFRSAITTNGGGGLPGSGTFLFSTAFAPAAGLTSFAVSAMYRTTDAF